MPRKPTCPSRVHKRTSHKNCKYHRALSRKTNVRMERIELIPFDYKLEIQEDQCPSTIKLEADYLPQVKFEPDITDEEVVETKCIPPPFIWTKKELVSSEDEVVETKCLLPPTVRIKEEFESIDDEVVEIKCIPPPAIRIKNEFASSDDRKDLLKIERLVENEFDGASLDSSSSTLSAPETRIIEDYLPVYKSEQMSDGESSECVDPPTDREREIKGLRALSSRSSASTFPANVIDNLENVLPTYSYGSIGTVLQHDHCYFRLPKKQVQQNTIPDSQGPTRRSSEPDDDDDDDTCSDGSSYGSEKRKPKKRQRTSYIGDYKEEDLADPQKAKMFAEAANSKIIRQQKTIKQLEYELKELTSEYNTLSLELQKFLDEYDVPDEVLQAAIQECGLNKCPIKITRDHTRKKD